MSASSLLLRALLEADDFGVSNVHILHATCLNRYAARLSSIASFIEHDLLSLVSLSTIAPKLPDATAAPTDGAKDKKVMVSDKGVLSNDHHLRVDHNT